MHDFAPVVDWLTYRSYEYNRSVNPHIPDYKWRRLYKDALDFEEIYENTVRGKYNVDHNE